MIPARNCASHTFAAVMFELSFVYGDLTLSPQNSLVRKCRDLRVRPKIICVQVFVVGSNVRVRQRKECAEG